MADLGETSYVGLAQRTRTPAERFSAPPQSYSLNSGFPFSSKTETERGATHEAVYRVPVLPVRRPSPQLVVYEMRGRDQDCATLSYRYWNSVGTPDFTGTLYTGPKCGVNPLVDVVVLGTRISP